MKTMISLKRKNLSRRKDTTTKRKTTSQNKENKNPCFYYNVIKEIIYMSITVNIYYKGKKDAARKFATEMMRSGIVEAIRKEEGNLQYEYFYPVEDDETVLLIDSWKDQNSIDKHHKTSMMQEIIKLREKYDLHMKVLRFIDEEVPKGDDYFIRK